MIPAANRRYLDLLLTDFYLPVQPNKREVATSSGMALCPAPKELDNIELTVIFGQKQTNTHYLALLPEEI
jgi:hypothetical protein